MIRMIAGAFAALLLVASPALAQNLGTEMDAVIDTTAAADQAIDTALTATLQADIAAQAGVSVDDIGTLSDQELADAVQALIANNPNLTAKQVTAIVRAGVRLRPQAAAVIAAGAATARPDLANAIARAAASVSSVSLAAIQEAITAALLPLGLAPVFDDGDEASGG